MSETHREAYARTADGGQGFDLELWYLDSIARLGAALTTTHLPATIVQYLSKALSDMFLPGAYLVVTTDLATESHFVALSHGIEGGASSTDPRVQRTLADGPVLDVAAGSWMGSPIIAAGRPYGAVCVIPPADVRYDKTDLAALNGLASVAGLALQGAHLFELLSVGKREWEATVDSIPQAFCIVDESGRVRRGNLAFCELVDVPVTAVTDRPWQELLPPDWIEPVSRVLALSVSERIEADDRVHFVSALKVRRGGSEHSVLIFDDVTASEELQSQLAQGAKMTAIGQLVSGVAHDLNSPLASIVGLADYLTSGNIEIPANLTEPLTAIRLEAERAANIVDQLLSFARKRDQIRSPQGIQGVLESTLRVMKSQLSSRRVVAVLDVEDSLPPVLVNFGQIQQVFVNLVNNATQAIALSGQGNRILITARRGEGDTVAVTFSDDGPGIDATDRPRVFEPFFTTKADSDGTGLGLSISAGIISEHGGQLTLEPQGGPGASFRVVLPAAEPGTHESDRISSTRLRNILVVEGELHMRRYLEATLSSWGHTVKTAANSEEGMAVLAHFPAQLVISELRPPHVAGRSLYDRLLADKPGLAQRVVFIIGATVAADTLGTLEARGLPYLRRPFSLSQLQAALAEIDASG